jgi:hypothetical protein
LLLEVVKEGYDAAGRKPEPTGQLLLVAAWEKGNLTQEAGLRRGERKLGDARGIPSSAVVSQLGEKERRRRPSAIDPLVLGRRFRRDGLSHTDTLCHPEIICK